MKNHRNYYSYSRYFIKKVCPTESLWERNGFAKILVKNGWEGVTALTTITSESHQSSMNLSCVGERYDFHTLIYKDWKLDINTIPISGGMTYMPIKCILTDTSNGITYLIKDVPLIMLKNIFRIISGKSKIIMSSKRYMNYKIDLYNDKEIYGFNTEDIRKRGDKNRCKISGIWKPLSEELKK